MSTPEILVKFQDPEMPRVKRFHSGDAGNDLFAGEDSTVKPGDTLLVRTKTVMALPSGYFGLLCIRSSLSLRGITLANCVGVIDSGYRGEILVPIKNLGKESFQVKKYSRIAQLIVLQYCTAKFVEADKLDTIDDRQGGFGSSGE